MPQTGSGNRKGQAQNYRRDVALSGIISIFVEQFCTSDPTLCGGFAAQVRPPPDHGGSAHAWRDLFALHNGVRSPQAQDGTMPSDATNTVIGKTVVALIQCP